MQPTQFNLISQTRSRVTKVNRQPQLTRLSQDKITFGMSMPETTPQKLSAESLLSNQLPNYTVKVEGKDYDVSSLSPLNLVTLALARGIAQNATAGSILPKPATLSSFIITHGLHQDGSEASVRWEDTSKNLIQEAYAELRKIGLLAEASQDAHEVVANHQQSVEAATKTLLTEYGLYTPPEVTVSEPPVIDYGGQIHIGLGDSVIFPKTPGGDTGVIPIQAPTTFTAPAIPIDRVITTDWHDLTTHRPGDLNEETQKGE